MDNDKMRGMKKGAMQEDQWYDPIMKLLNPSPTPIQQIDPTKPLSTYLRPRSSMNDVQPSVETPEEQMMRFQNLRRILGQA